MFPTPYEFDPKIGILTVNKYSRLYVIVAMKKLATPWDTKVPQVLDIGVGRKDIDQAHEPFHSRRRSI